MNKNVCPKIFSDFFGHKASRRVDWSRFEIIDDMAVLGIYSAIWAQKLIFAHFCQKIYF